MRTAAAVILTVRLLWQELMRRLLSVTLKQNIQRLHRSSFIAACLFIMGGLLWVACTRKPAIAVGEGAVGNYPAAVGRILVNKCAVAGCHNQASYQNAGGLLLDTWEHMLQGGNSGAEVIAYSPKYSPLLFFVNTDPALGTVATPTMPLSLAGNPQVPLSKDEYNTLYQWIANGAPDKSGNIPFAGNADRRQKIYISQQGCDLVAVVDAQSKLVMRYIPVGVNSAGIESPHCIRSSSDGAYVYAAFTAGTAIQRIDTRTDEVTGNITMGAGSWNILYVAPGDTALVTTDFTTSGRVVFANTTALKTQPWLTGGGAGSFVFPHGITSNPRFDTTFVTAQYGNIIYKYAQNAPYYKRLSLDGNPPAATNSADSTSPNPHEIMMALDGSRYFVACQGTNDVRVMDAHKDTLIAKIPVGKFPQELAMSRKKPYLFVTCMEDPANPNAKRKGSVYVIDYNTLQVVKAIYGDFFQPHGITVDDINDKVFIVSANNNPNGPAAHHAVACGDRPGWYSVYNLNTLLPDDSKQYTVTIYPYSAATRFRQ